MPFATGKWKPYLASAAIACLGAFSAQPASASVCFTSGKVYVQQKVYDKAAYFLECARKGDPANIEALSLLAFARARQREFISAGAAFQLAIETATKKGDKKKVEDLQRNRLAENAQLFNAGIAALNRAGSVSLDNERSSGDEGSPQGKIEKQYGPPREYARFTEAGRIHEFWCYPDSGVTFYFAPSSDEATRLEYKPYEGLGDLQHAVTDTTVFPLYAGGSYVAEAAYDFQLASYVDPMSLDTYQNLAYVLSLLGRTDDAIRAAQRGLTIKPDDERLHQNLRAAAMSRGNRLYNAKKYPEAIQAYRQAMLFDPQSAPGYVLKIADAWYAIAGSRGKGTPEQKAAYDSAAVGYAAVVEQPAASDSVKQNALYNAAVIYANQEIYPKAIEILDRAGGLYPKNKEIWSLAGQTKYQAKDAKGAEAALRHALELDPQDATNHQFLFLALNQLSRKEESVAEYTIYKALSEGTKKTEVKVWVDSADNRLGASNQLKTVVKTESYPEEVYTYNEGDKRFETWFYWSKGKSFTFMDGQIFSKGAFPPKKSS
ncbi:MAG: hypothetical protein E6K76_08205 [Candidatus Eisenbacteria bacterium]|uniref:Tetratricopeptide repeat protein n=1 Tax=Eiseniibacteriota bacterium TaxID=2212470 RepID=A0A538T3Y2_UNCEI|nr:MAG: hypothetical protein E6K76_08205 [Candidatus Eisenbacteria bacterium]